MTSTAPWPRLDAVVIGAQKAGSTHLAARLGRHPGLYMCPDEVPIFEDPFYANSDPSALAAAVARADPHQRRGIHRPDYLAHREVPARLRDRTPDVRLVVVLREPIERAVSAYCWYVQFGLLPVRPPDAGLSALLEGWQDPGYPHAGEILDYGRYGHHLRHWLTVFPREQLLVLGPEALVGGAPQDPLLDFLGLAPHPGLADHEHRANRGVYDPRRIRFMRARARFAFSWDSTERYTYRPRRLRRPVGSAVAAAATVIDRQLLARVFGNAPPSISPALRARLAAYYAEDGQVLADEVLGDAPSWQRP